MTNEKFCLRWNDFEGNISSAFRELRDDKDFFDVTLACDDEQIQAHKVILSACSPFFRSVLRRNPHQHPLLYLKGVKYIDLQAVLNFMYQGEVNVAQEELNSFLAVAEDLKVKGLTQNNEKSQTQKDAPSYRSAKETQPTKTFQRHPDREPQPPVQHHKQEHLADHTARDADIQEIVPIKSEPHEIPERNPITTKPHHQKTQAYNQPHPVAVAVAEQENTLAQYQEEEGVYEEDYGQYEEQYADQVGQDMSVGHNQGGDSGALVPGHELPACKSPSDLLRFCVKSPVSSKWVCDICGQFTNHGRGTVRNHVESKHFPTTFQYQCDYEECDKICNTKKALEVHVSRNHKLTTKFNS